MNIKYLLSICCVLFTLNVFAEDKPFQNGEKLIYSLNYKARFAPNAEVAEATFFTSKVTNKDKDCYHLYANVQCHSFFRWFYHLNDTYQSWIDASTLQPYRLKIDLEESDYRFKGEYNYNWSDKNVKTSWKTLKNPQGGSKTMQLGDNSFDALALFYNLRASDIVSEYTPLADRTLSLVLEDTIRSINYKFIGREVKNIKRLGKFNTLKFSCRLVTTSGENFEDGTELFLWISDDENKILLYLESPIKIGSVVGRLKSYENLKHPLSSKIKK